MQKINLLPSYFQDRKKIVLAWAVVGILVALVVAAMVGARVPLTQRLAALNADVDRNNTALQKVKSLQDAAAAKTQEASIYDPSLTMMRDMRVYNLKRPALYQRTANYVYRDATVLGMSSTSTVLTMDAYVSNIGDLSRTFLYLHRDPDFTGVTLSAVPAFRTARKVQVFDEANQPPPEFPTAGALPGGMPDMGGPRGMGAMMGSGGGGRMGAMAGGMMGSGGGGMSGGGGRMGAMAGAMMGSGGGSPYGGGGMSGGGGRMGAMMMGGGMMGGGGGAGNQAIPGIDPARLPPGREALGNVVVFACALKDPITRQGGGNDVGGGGGMGRMGGMMGSGMGGGMMGSGMGGMMGGMGPRAPGAGSGGMMSGGMSGGSGGKMGAAP